jgi:hypothetical protein
MILFSNTYRAVDKKVMQHRDAGGYGVDGGSIAHAQERVHEVFQKR